MSSPHVGEVGGEQPLVQDNASHTLGLQRGGKVGGIVVATTSSSPYRGRWRRATIGCRHEGDAMGPGSEILGEQAASAVGSDNEHMGNISIGHDVAEAYPCCG